MKRMRKVKKMQLGAEPKATVNKKTAGIFLALVALVAFAGIMGATLSNNVSAGRQGDVSRWNWAYERVLHFSTYKITGAKFSKSRPLESANTIAGGCMGAGANGLMVYGDGDFNNPDIRPTFTKGWCYALGGPVNGDRLYGGIPDADNPDLAQNDKGQYFVQNWNPIDADYAPGYIDLGTSPIYLKEKVNGKERLVLNEYSGLPITSGIRWIDSAHIYFPAETKINSRTGAGAKTFNGKTVSRLTVAKTALEGVTTSYGLSWCDNSIYNYGKGIENTVQCKFPDGKQNKNEFNYVDQIKGASYLGQLYDVRKYVWSGGNGGDCNSPYPTIRLGKGGERAYGSNTRACNAVTMFEFHFYPSGTLERLDDELMFQNIQVEFWHDENGNPYIDKEGEAYSVIRSVPAYVHRPKLIRYTAANKPNQMVIDQNDPTNWTYFNECLNSFAECIEYANNNDLRSYAAYLNTHIYTEDEYYSLSSQCDRYLTDAYNSKETINRNVICMRADYQAWLYKQEKSVGIVEKKGDQYEYSYGTFKGFMLGDDIDGSNSYNAEGYQIVQGFHKAWLPISDRKSVV